MENIRIINKIDKICKYNIHGWERIFLIRRLIEEWRNEECEEDTKSEVDEEKVEAHTKVSMGAYDKGFSDGQQDIINALKVIPDLNQNKDAPDKGQEISKVAQDIGQEKKSGITITNVQKVDEEFIEKHMFEDKCKKSEQDVLCECGHERDWHSKGGACRHDTWYNSGCKCKEFIPQDNSALNLKGSKNGKK